MAHPARKRELVDGICWEWGVSIRRACDALEMDRSTYHYRSRRPGQAPFETRIKEICETRVRYGSRRVHVLLRREGWMINHKKTRRIYNELGMRQRNRTPKRRVKAKLQEDHSAALAANEIWAMDFVHDQLATSRKLRMRGPPEVIRPDNGAEFIAEKVRGGIGAVGAKTTFIEPGSPWENGYCESFNARFPTSSFCSRGLGVKRNVRS